MKVAITRKELLDIAGVFAPNGKDFRAVHKYLTAHVGTGYDVTVVFKVGVRSVVSVASDGAINATTKRLGRMSSHIPSVLACRVKQGATGAFTARLVNGSFIDHDLTVDMNSLEVDSSLLLRISQNRRPVEHISRVQVIATNNGRAASVLFTGHALEGLYNAINSRAR